MSAVPKYDRPREPMLNGIDFQLPSGDIATMLFSNPQPPAAAAPWFELIDVFNEKAKGAPDSVTIDHGVLLPPPEVVTTDRVRCGLLFRWGSLWVGGHWSTNNKRLCLNLIPFITFWVTLPGGKTP